MFGLFKRVCLFVFCVAATGQAAQAQDATIQLYPDQKFQTINGWEVLARGWEYDKAADRFDGSWYQDKALHDRIIDALVEQAGINRVRIEIRSGMENPIDYWALFERGEIGYKKVKSHFYHKVNDNGDPFKARADGFHFSYLDFQIENIIKPMQERLQARGETLYINLCVVDFKWGGEEQSNFKLASNPQEYAELVTQAMLHLKNTHGIVPDALEVILEPENTNGWRGFHIGRAGAAASDRLNQHQMAPELLLPSVLNARNAVRYFEAAISVPGVAPRTGAITYHRYAGRRASVMGDIRNAAARRGIRVEMLEYTNGTVEDLIQDVTVAQASAWQLFSIIARHPPASSEVARSVLFYGTPEDGKIGLSHQGRSLAQYFRYVRRGAERIGAVTDNGDFLGLAFVNPDYALYPGAVVVIRSQRAGEVAVNGLPYGRYGVSYSGAGVVTGELPPLTVEGAQATLSVPANSVVTIYPAP
ncbi:hypothetical protein [Ruegeria sp. HKCCD7255]|uniref:hypothetical protein n=1 Tax=Ruegeria sp. HKCCD7255 TaxID=2683004 RepID=UPI001488E365|nr:hypothetical protein [Ruegeria sp. HKCCD7255]